MFILPFAAQPLGLVPDLDEVLIVLYDDVVLVELSVEVRLGAALVVHNVELVLRLAGLGLHVYAVVSENKNKVRNNFL